MRTYEELRERYDRGETFSRSDVKVLLDIIESLRQVPARALDNVEDAAVKVARDATATSRKAAFKLLPRSGSQRRKVLDVYVRLYPAALTDDDVSRETGLPLNSVRPRRLELVEGGWLNKSSVVKKSDAGNDAQTYFASARAMEEKR